MSETPFADSLLEWGRNGSFYPALIPDPESLEELHQLQAQILAQDPEATLSGNLHSTFFYVRPPKLFKRLQEIKPAIGEATLHNELATTMASLALIMHMYPFKTGVEGLERFGPNGEMLALRLKDMELRAMGRALLERNLSWAGFKPEDFAELAKEPDYQWVFGPSNIHISLASNVGLLDTSELMLPLEVKFASLSDGSVQAKGDDVEQRLMWYLGLKS